MGYIVFHENKRNLILLYIGLFMFIKYITDDCVFQVWFCGVHVYMRISATFIDIRA